MTGTPESNDFDELMDRHLDGELSLEEGQRLARLLIEDPKNAERFARSAAMLHLQMRSLIECDRTPMSSDSSETSIPFVASPDPTSASWPAGNQPTLFEAFGNLFKNTFSLSMSLAVVGVVAAFALGAASVWWFDHRVAAPAHRIAATAPHVTPVAYLTSAHGCGWGENSAPMKVTDGVVNSGDQLTLLEGIAQFRLASGVSLNVEGPASLVMTSPSSLILQQGTLTADIPWGVGGFEVLAGTTRLMTSEAEFGMQAKGSGVSIHVFSGEATAMLSPYAAKSFAAISDEDFVADDGSNPASIKIEQSEAAELTANTNGKTTVRKTVADQTQFASRTAMAGQLPITPRYVEAVKKCSPVAYWRFEAVENGQIRNEITTGCPLQVITKPELPGDNANRVLELGAAAIEKGDLISTAPMDSAFRGDFTVELWIKPSHYHNGVLISVMDKAYLPGPLDKEAQDGQAPPTYFGYRMEIAPDFGRRPGTLQSVLFDPQQKAVAECCYSENNLYKIRQWQHVVAVRGSWGTQLYLDGQRVAEAKRRLDASMAEGQPLVIGRVLSYHTEKSFIGQLDELAVYDRVLSEEEIKDHFDAVNGHAVEQKRPSESRKATPAPQKAVRYVNES